MFHQVSWQIYVIAFAVVAGLYYIAVFVFFFSKGIRDRISKSINSRNGERKGDSHGDIEQAGSNDYQTYQSLRDDMTAYIDAAEPEMFKSDILFSLASIIKRYPALTDERFQEALIKEIRRMYLQKYNDGIEEEELSVLWQL